MDIQEFLRTNNQHVTKLKRTLGCTCADHAKFQEKGQRVRFVAVNAELRFSTWRKLNLLKSFRNKT